MSLIDQLQDRVAGLIGISPSDRVAVVEGTLRRSHTDSVGYWLQLVLSTAIATLGLAMGSTAVVIGAMLISPLMQPLIELGIGLATGSLLLTFRAGTRTASSVAVVVLGAAGLTRLLPFHEITSELAARTSPTMIDLFIAAFCALAAAYTTVRQGKDVISAAAGTAIGISLVPPLCTAGYGLGISTPEVFQGAILLFTANFAAIIAVTAVAVLALGFGQVHVGDIEDSVQEPAARGRVAYRIARKARRLAGRRLGVLTRLLIPAILLGAIIVPLKRALEEVSWQVRVRSDVDEMLAGIPGTVVRQSLDVRGGLVRVRLLLVGSEAEARAVSADLRRRIAAVSGREPFVEVIAVPDAASLDAMAMQLRAATTPPSTPPTPEPVAVAAMFATTLEQVTARHWPTASGELVRVRASAAAGTPPSLELEVFHLGPPLGAAGAQLLEAAWGAELGVPISVTDHPIPLHALEAEADDGGSWLADAARLVEATHGLALRLCIVVPAPPAAPPPSPRRRAAREPLVGPTSADVLRAVVGKLARARPDIDVATGDRWSIGIDGKPCEAPAATRADPPIPP